MATPPKAEISVAPATLTLRPGGVVIMGLSRSLLQEERAELARALMDLLPMASGIIIIGDCSQPFAFVINVEASDGN